MLINQFHLGHLIYKIQDSTYLKEKSIMNKIKQTSIADRAKHMIHVFFWTDVDMWTEALTYVLDLRAEGGDLDLTAQ